MRYNFIDFAMTGEFILVDYPRAHDIYKKMYNFVFKKEQRKDTLSLSLD